MHGQFSANGRECQNQWRFPVLLSYFKTKFLDRLSGGLRAKLADGLAKYIEEVIDP